ncbi:hypothetical protein BVG16_18320 [Paenibacillus selenitireducens]|uniref:Nucleoid-associated protein n=1 Tax=Paenibacillus selenitireducens TaxID=1324314 RepID=A0A1T2X8F6_9BACL|nr:nucleoid-associated protein [Paenibacillus selenitireducens]OPA76168.1 hypothetical protein BVG16_18320 [Paenibacillus selenitireducens]
MINLTNVEIQDIVIHRVGNKSKDEGVAVAKECFEIDNDELREALLKYFLASFKFDATYRFHHEADIALNEVYTYTNAIFKDSTTFYDQSVHILRHLYEQSSHPQIKSGELYVVHFNHIIYDNFSVDAVGIFKSENKDEYLKIDEQEPTEFQLQYEQGVNIKKLDKGCIIFNFNANAGFHVSLVDLSNKGPSNEAVYWRDDFLQVKVLEDEHYMTDQYIRMCSDFYDNVVATTNDQFEKKEKLVFLNETIQHFAKNEQFVEETFFEEVIRDPEYTNMFKTYKETYEEMNELPPMTDFNISQNALKKVKRQFKNDIKLDTNIEIKVNNESFDYLEKGYDEERNMYYYKVYFNNEA